MASFTKETGLMDIDMAKEDYKTLLDQYMMEIGFVERRKDLENLNFLRNSVMKVHFVMDSKVD